MRLTQILRAQHLGFMMKRHWIVQGKRTIRETGARAALEAQGISVDDAMAFVYEKPKFGRLPKVVGYKPEEPKFDETHEFWNERKCHMYGNSNVLLEGVPQAQVLTKTLDLKELPETIQNSVNKIKISPEMDQTLRNIILDSYIFDAEQKKLIKRKVPGRPAFNLPRDFGITDARKCRLIISRLLFECEKLSGRTTATNRKIVDDAFFVFPFEKYDDLIQMEINAETFLTSKEAIVLDEPKIDVKNAELPDIYPIKYTVSMLQQNIYHRRDSYPISLDSTYSNPHTIFLHYSPLEVANLHGTEVTPLQYKSRSMLKAFTVAAANARIQFGPNVKDLPSPIVVQSIQTNGKSFYFGIYQLNTLDLNGTTGKKNYWYSLPENLDFYNECSYELGRPVLKGYNNDVFKYILSFYRNS